MQPDQDLLRRLDAAGEALERLEAGDMPTAAELAAAPRLDWWSISEDGPFPVLQGVVSGHPSLHDGAYVATSPLIWIADDKALARTLNRLYKLGPRLEETLQRPN